ncbi:aspartic peptidase domain-containing protein [Collybia nuda]|uniref:Aspartic peptidase domain-containing protein n=1 Tax=Collybia nuda TaxID=64659 RepID=A0A9P5XSU9_9AGAR|nr:aspartic peptidase domain-containing protein [Collybia nuda]
MRFSIALTLLSALALLASASDGLRGLSTGFVKRSENGLHLPIHKQKASFARRRGLTASIGLGDFVDVTYNVLLTVGGVSTSVVLDTGSSDLWVISDTCTACPKSVPHYPQATFQSTGLEVKLLYGDSRTGTHAYGLIGKDTVDLAGLKLDDQYFAAINNTNTTVAETGSAGIFGLGFPANSVIWNAMLAQEREVLGGTNLGHDNTRFPNFSELFGRPGSRRRQTSAFVDAVFSSYPRIAPFLGRLISTGNISTPMFAVTLQRDTVDVGGNAGMLSIGALPGGVKNESLTWVPVRTYSAAEHGLPPPPDSPNERYPLTWEVFIDDVYLDGQKLPRSTLSSPSIALSALVDTGSSHLRGPADVVQSIMDTLGMRYSCSEPHSLAFQIGGKMFPVDPRDFSSQFYMDSVSFCTPMLMPTDPPKEGRYLYSWSLGDPFLKSVLASYHYGNLTYPSQDPPRMGFLSTVPSDANDQMREAVKDASQNGGNFPVLSEVAPTGAPEVTHTNANGVPEAKTTTRPKISGATHLIPVAMIWLLAPAITLVFL